VRHGVPPRALWHPSTVAAQLCTPPPHLLLIRPPAPSAFRGSARACLRRNAAPDDFYSFLCRVCCPRPPRAARRQHVRAATQAPAWDPAGARGVATTRKPGAQAQRLAPELGRLGLGPPPAARCRGARPPAVPQPGTASSVDFERLSFAFTETRCISKYTWRNGVWDEGELQDDPYLSVHCMSSGLHYGQASVCAGRDGGKWELGTGGGQRVGVCAQRERGAERQEETGRESKGQGRPRCSPPPWPRARGAAKPVACDVQKTT